MKAPPPKRGIRDTGPYTSRTTSTGAVVTEAGLLVSALASGLSLEDVRRECLDGTLLRQKTRASRFRVWQVLHYRLFAPGCAWTLEDMKSAVTEHGPHSPEFVSLVYVHYALRDHLTFDFVTRVLAPTWAEARVITREDLLCFLDQNHDGARRWSEASRRKLSSNILSALRDFGLLKGVQTKRIVRPLLPLSTAEHLLRILVSEGIAGSDVLRDPTWRLFLLSPDDVAHVLTQLAQTRPIGFERVGGTVVLTVPDAWRSTP